MVKTQHITVNNILSYGVIGNTSVFGTEESRFEPLWDNNKGGLAQLARALALHVRGHRFDSDILHNKLIVVNKKPLKKINK
jgi:hypothetical protein